jgi:hypothetical protein
MSFFSVDSDVPPPASGSANTLYSVYRVQEHNGS